MNSPSCKYYVDHCKFVNLTLGFYPHYSAAYNIAHASALAFTYAVSTGESQGSKQE